MRENRNYQSVNFEKELSINNLFWSVCQQWRKLLIVAIIFAILGGLYSINENIGNQKIQAQIENGEHGLTNEQVDKVDLFLGYEKVYRGLMDQCENSPKMNFDADGFYQFDLDYYIDNHYSVTYPEIEKSDNITSINDYFVHELSTEKFYNEIIKVLPDEVGMQYIGDYLAINALDESAGIEQDSHNLKVVIRNNDKNTAEKIADIVKDTIDQAKKNGESIYGPFDITLSNSNIGRVVDNDIINYQKYIVQSLADYQARLDNLEVTFDDRQKMYAINKGSILFKESEMTEGNDINSSATGVDENEGANSNKSTNIQISKKLIVVGFVGGFLFMAIICAIMYILSNVIMLEDDFEGKYGILCLARISQSEKKTLLLDKWILKHMRKNIYVLDVQNAIEIAKANIENLVTDDSNDKVGVCVVGENVESAVTGLSEELKKDGIEALICKNPFKDINSTKIFNEVNTIVLVGYAGKSKNSDFEQILKRYYYSKSLSVIVVE